MLRQIHWRFITIILASNRADIPANMKKFYILFYCVLCSVILYAQVPAKDTVVPSKGNIKNQLKEIKNKKIALQSDSAGNEPVELLHFDSTKTNRYGDLLNDDTAYNKKKPLWKPALQVV